ncbi:MAG: helix-turn-helix domain-containing protein [bacterium]|nr:helix-turn-helix domain-containing protein [bacterium]
MNSDIPNLLQPTEGEQIKQDSQAQVAAVGAGKKNKWSLDDLPPLLTVREVAEILRVSPLTVKRWTKRGRLPAIRINSRGDRRYRKETILYYLGVQEK